MVDKMHQGPPGREEPLEKPRLDPDREAREKSRTVHDGVSIAIRGLTLSLGNRVILDNIDMDIKRGKTLAVMGLSGMGKSTLLRCIMRLQEPDSGRIFIDGEDVLKMNWDELTRVRRKMGMVFQKAALFDSMTVAENVGFGLREHTKKSDEEIREIVSDKLSIVDLAAREITCPRSFPEVCRKEPAWPGPLPPTGDYPVGRADNGA